MTDQPNTQTPTTKRDGHLIVYLAWPILAGVALAVILSVSIGGIVLLATRFDVGKAGMTAGVTFFAVLGIATLAIFWYAAHEFVGPRSSERIETTRQTVEYLEPDMPEPTPRFIRLGGRARINDPAPMLPSGASRSSIRQAMTHLVDNLTQSAAVTEVAHETETLEPVAPPWVKEMYTILCAAWPDKLARRDFQSLWPTGGTALWKKYINGDGSGRHGGKGILDTWGVIAKKDGRGKWEFCHDLETIFSLDHDLYTYAQEMAERVQHSPGLGLAMENAKKPVPNQTKPNYQTENQTRKAS